MKTIEEMNSFDDIDNYYEAEIPQFIQEILEERVEALKHCITYKKEIERLTKRLEESQLAYLQVDKDKQKLHSIIKEVREYIKSFNIPKDLGVLGEAPISISELKHILEILDKENKNVKN